MFSPSEIFLCKDQTPLNKFTQYDGAEGLLGIRNGKVTNR